MNELEPRFRGSLRQPQAPVIDIMSAIPTYESHGAATREYAGLFEYWKMVLRHKIAVIVAIVVAGAIAFVGTLSSPRIYQARTTLEIQGLNEDFLNMKNVTPVSDANTGYLETDIQTQVRLLQSNTIISSVGKKLAAADLPAGLQPPDRFGMWRQALKINPPTADALWHQALATAAGSVRARATGTNRIVELSCDSTNPQVAADFCNTLTREFIDQSLEARWKTTEYTGQWLTKQLDDLKIKLEKQEEDMQSYARATGLVITAEKNDAHQTQLTAIESELSAARADRISRQSKYEMASSSPPSALPEVLDDPALKASQSVLADLKAKLAQLSVTFTPQHAEVRKVRAQIASIESSLDASSASILTRVRNDFDAAQRRERLLESTYQSQLRLVSSKAEALAHYNLLKRDVDATRLLYETLLQRLKEASIAAAMRASNIRVVDAALVPGAPYKPDVLRAIAAGLLFGGIVGIAFAIVRERRDRTLLEPGDVSYYLGLQELGVVPVGTLMEAHQAKKLPQLTPGFGGESIGALNSAERVELISFHQKTSLLAESFRTTLTSILFSKSESERPRVLVLTSASPNEGKTTVVSNLGITVAELHRRVLVIDADLRRPRLHQVFGVKNDEGLSNLLARNAPLEWADLNAVCTETHVGGLFFLPSGSSRSHASSLLHSSRLEEVIALARDHFDTVLIDTPPMVNIADARVLARLGDALVLVVRSGVTTRDAALVAKTRFSEDGTPILGTILNFWNPNTPGYGYYKSYYAGYYHYYGPGDGGPPSDSGNGAGPTDSAPHSSAEPDGSVWRPGFVFRRQMTDGATPQKSQS